MNCQFLPSGASIVPSCALQLLFGKNHNIAKNSTTTKARENISTELISLDFFGAC
jgi:hypothetical protein